LAGVAPFTGAWIETTREHYKDKVAVSRPSRARGLKLKRQDAAGEVGVAPFTGAWIETYR